jgi:hypothetical protein
MKKSMLFLGFLAAVVGMLISGCTKKDSLGPADQSTGVTSEKAVMVAAAVSDAFVANGAEVYAFADPRVAPTDYNESVAKTDSMYAPHRWGRFITSTSEKTTTLSVSGDTLATALVQRTVSGTFKVRMTINGVDSIVSKPFTDTSAKLVILKKVDSLAHFWTNWIPVASSLVKGATSPSPANNGIVLTELDIKSSTDSLTITDPLSYWLKYNWLNCFRGDRHRDMPHLNGGESLTVTAKVMSQSADTDVVALRSGFGMGSMHYLRAKMTMVSQTGPDANGYYTRVYTKTTQPRFGIGANHIGVDAITKGTLADPSAPYSVSWWGVPFMMF